MAEKIVLQQQGNFQEQLSINSWTFENPVNIRFIIMQFFSEPGGCTPFFYQYIIYYFTDVYILIHDYCVLGNKKRELNHLPERFHKNPVHNEKSSRKRERHISHSRVQLKYFQKFVDSIR